MKSHICLVIKIDKFGIESIEITINEGGGYLLLFPLVLFYCIFPFSHQMVVGELKNFVKCSIICASILYQLI